MILKLLHLIGKPLAWAISHSPIKFQLALGWMIGVICFDILRIRRKVILENITRAFPEKPLKERISLGRRSWVNLGRTLVEYARLPFLELNDSWSLNLFELIGHEHYLKAAAKGKGVILLSLHMGSADFAISGFPLFGIRLSTISKVFTIRWINKIWFDVRQKLGNEYLPPKNISLRLLKKLRNKENILFINDQYITRSEGIRTLFFGHETNTAVGLAVIAHRTQVPVVPVFSFRKNDGTTILQFEEELQFDQFESREDFYLHCTQKCNDHLESIVRRHPGEWYWLHRRWK